VSSRMDSESGRVVGVTVCHWPDVEGEDVMAVVRVSRAGGVKDAFVIFIAPLECQMTGSCLWRRFACSMRRVVGLGGE
jgi:hypothetical protein